MKDAEKAILLYQEAVSQIVAFDSAGTIKAAWRRARYPVNRLSLLLERRGELRKAQEAILVYEQFNDAFGLTSAEKKCVDARKQRLARKLNI